jgi:hypothetical protein
MNSPSTTGSEVAEMRRYDGIGLAVLMLASFAFGSPPARAEGGAPFDGRAARKALAERYEKVQRDRQRSWTDEDDQTDAEAPPEKRPVGADGSSSPESPRARASEPPRAPTR